MAELLQAAENGSNLEKADILELTVSQLRHMVANTHLQGVYGYSACVHEVDHFLARIRYDDTTRRRIVQHLCRRRPSLVPATQDPPTFARRRRVPADAESTSGGADSDQVRMFSYSSADSTTDGTAEPCEAGSSTTAHVDGHAGTICGSEVAETANSAVCGGDKMSDGVLSTDDTLPLVTDAERRTADADNGGSNLQDEVVGLVSPVWRPW